MLIKKDSSETLSENLPQGSILEAELVTRLLWIEKKSCFFSSSFQRETTFSRGFGPLLLMETSTCFLSKGGDEQITATQATKSWRKSQ